MFISVLPVSIPSMHLGVATGQPAITFAHELAGQFESLTLLKIWKCLSEI
jgi:hypothetical protein